MFSQSRDVFGEGLLPILKDRSTLWERRPSLDEYASLHRESRSSRENIASALAPIQSSHKTLR